MGWKEGWDKWHQLSLPMVIFATIFFKTVFLFVNFLSLLSAASSSARNSCGIASRRQRRREGIEYSDSHLNLSSLKELRILALRHESLLRCGSNPNLNDDSQCVNRDRSGHKLVDRSLDTHSHASISQVHTTLVVGLPNPLYRRRGFEGIQVCEQRTSENLCVFQTGIGTARSAILQEQEPTQRCAVLAQGDRNAEVWP